MLVMHLTHIEENESPQYRNQFHMTNYGNVFLEVLSISRLFPFSYLLMIQASSAAQFVKNF